MRDLSIEVYRRGAAHAEQQGIIVADTKFEFGLVDTPGKPASLMLIDEVLTPDSSRFWPADAYAPGGAQPSYDKQYVRDYLEQIGWNKQPPAPALPPDVVANTREKYVEAFRRLTGANSLRAVERLGLASQRPAATSGQSRAHMRSRPLALPRPLASCRPNPESRVRSRRPGVLTVRRAPSYLAVDDCEC